MYPRQQFFIYLFWEGLSHTFVTYQKITVPRSYIFTLYFLVNDNIKMESLFTKQEMITDNDAETFILPDTTLVET